MTDSPNDRPLPLVDAGLLAQAKEYVGQRCATVPPLALILGSGLGSFADSLRRPLAISTATIPGYPKSTVEGHAGRWVFGEVGGRRVLVMQGRVHMYEGYSARAVGFPIHLMAELGIKRLVVTNAAGGANPLLTPGNLMLIDDHVNLMFTNPLRGQHRKAWGDRWPDMVAPYDPQLQRVVLECAAQLRIPLRRGVLFASKGPSYETEAEIRMARMMGADAVTMSTVPEVIVAVARGLQVIGISCITNMATGLASRKLDHAEVTETARRISKSFTELLTAIISRLA